LHGDLLFLDFLNPLIQRDGLLCFLRCLFGNIDKPFLLPFFHIELCNRKMFLCGRGFVLGVELPVQHGVDFLL
jgi:hypothetical protein